MDKRELEMYKLEDAVMTLLYTVLNVMLHPSINVYENLADRIILKTLCN